MAQGTANVPPPGAPGSLPAVSLELHHGSAPPTRHDLNDVSFLIGSVPGCDLRLPGANLPSVVCLLSRAAGGVTLRKLAPVHPVLVNGRAITTTTLSDGDRVGIGSIELRLHIRPAERVHGPSPAPTPQPFPDADFAAKVADIERREQKLAGDQANLQKEQAQHQGDLVRLDRLRGALDQREEELRSRSEELNHHYEQMRREAAELEDQARQMDEWHSRLVVQAEEFARSKEEQDKANAQVQQRAAALEGQQAMLAALRTRLERMREDIRREEIHLTEQRVAQAAAEADLQRTLKEAESLRAELDNERQLRERERAAFSERQAVLETAVARLREAQDAAARQEQKLREREANLAAETNKLEERAATLEARAVQLQDLHERMNADREALAQREAALSRAEQTLAALQEQLRRRSEEIAARQRAQSDQAREYEATLAALDTRRAEAERECQQAEQRVAEARKQLDARAEELDRRTADLEQKHSDLAQREGTLIRSIERLKEAGRAVGQRRKELAEAQTRSEIDKQRVLAALAQSQRDFEAARDEVLDLQRQLSDLEGQAREAAERLGQAREQLRGHLAEVHDYTRQSRQDLEALRSQVRAEAERVRQQESALHQDRDEHRLAVAAFRQQLIDWQAHVEDLKRALARGETRLERRRAEVDEKVRAVDETSQRLARQAEELRQQERAVAEQRSEVERHLEDMRVWYRHKLRELAGIRAEPESQAPGPGQTTGHAEGRDILALTGDVDPPDQKLGGLLQSLGLVDADTLNALLVEARRQRRSLRQLLLAGGYLTLYQMALIEAGDLDALMLGPLRVIDRLRATPMETVYRVFDPRRNHEALLRHLGEEQMHDAVRPDEFRQRFAAAAAVAHPHLAATLEVLEIADRPATLQESLKGLASCDWPPLAGAPGVWFRLVNQAFLGLHAAHEAGLIHGHLQAAQILLTPEGVLKLCGFGEPPWMAGSADQLPLDTDAAADVMDLGRIAAAWAISSVAGKKSRSKPFPASLQNVLDRFTSADPTTPYRSAAEVLEALDAAGAEVPANAAAWERLVQQVGDQATDTAVRLSA